MKLLITVTSSTYDEGSSTTTDVEIKGNREEVEWLLDRMHTAALVRACEALERAAEAVKSGE